MSRFTINTGGRRYGKSISLLWAEGICIAKKTADRLFAGELGEYTAGKSPDMKMMTEVAENAISPSCPDEKAKYIRGAIGKWFREYYMSYELQHLMRKHSLWPEEEWGHE